MSKFVHIFPLSIYRDSLTLAPDYKQQLIDSILQMEDASQKKSVDRAWLGDTAGHEFLFQREEFQELFRAIAVDVPSLDFEVQGTSESKPSLSWPKALF